LSSDLRASRELSNDPFGRFMTMMSRKFSAFINKDQAELVENPEDIYSDGQDVDSVLRYHSFAMTKKFDLATDYESASEPDVDKVKLMLGVILPNLGNQMTDESEFGNHATIVGEPILVDGNFDLGVFDGTDNPKSLAVRFNRPTGEFVNDEYMIVPDNSGLQILLDSTGFSIFLRFRIHDLSEQGGWSRTLFEKLDDSTVNNGIRVLVDSSGRVVIRPKRAGTHYANQTDTGTITTNTVIEMWLTFAVSGNVVKCYINNVDKTLSSISGNESWHGTTSNHDLAIFARGGTSTSGKVYGDFYTMMIIKGKVVSATEVGHHFTNKITLADIAFGHVAVGNLGASN
jgi:hypothetical protein